MAWLPSLPALLGIENVKTTWSALLFHFPKGYDCPEGRKRENGYINLVLHRLGIGTFIH